jgi:acetyl esterase
MRSALLDPEVAALLDRLEASGAPSPESLPLEEARRGATSLLRELGGEPEPVARIDDVEIPGPAGPIPIRIYDPGTSADRPCLVYFHGGGWVLCDLDSHDSVARALARRSGAVIVSVGYRLGPEHRFPAAVEDAYAATAWVAANASRFGIDVHRLAVGGDSAGGNLATVVALRSRDENGPALALQALIYPVTNLASFDTASYGEFADGHNLTRGRMEWFRSNYLAGPEDGQHPHASPLLASDVSGLPAALVITAECDVLRDEGEAYARRLELAGVPVTLTRYPGMIHPFFSMPGALTQARRAIDQVAQTIAAIRPACTS